MAKVSICVPTYNNPECVRQLLDSIRVQTYQDYEVLISDDSTDNRIEELMEKYVDMPVTYRHNPKPLGHIFNWNAAIRMASGEYIKIMFSDDWFTFPYSLERLTALLDNNPEASLAFSGSMQVSSKTCYARSPKAGYVEALAQDHRRLFMGNEIGAPSDTLYRYDPQIAFDEKSNWASDVFFYFEILNRNPRFVSTPDPLISIGIHDEQYTNTFSDNDERIYNDYAYMFEKYSLKDSAECRAYFLKEYLIRQPKGLAKALAHGYSRAEFQRAKTYYYASVVLPCYAKAVLGKLVKPFKGLRK